MVLSKIRGRLISLMTPSQGQTSAPTLDVSGKTGSAIAAGPDAFIVYTLPKVGQSTMYHSCLSTFPKIPVFRTQNLESKDVVDFLASRSYEELAVITGAREPISWALSFMVQEIYRSNPDVIAGFNRGQMNPADATNIMRDFIDERQAFSHYSAWFDGQVSKFIEIDVLSHPFDHERKRMIIEHPPYRVLCFRNEDSDMWAGVLSEFFRTESVTVKAANVALFKDYSLFYYEVLMGLSYSQERLDEIYASRMVRTFYTDAEIEQFKERWSRPIPKCYADYIRDMLKKLTSPQFQYIRNIYDKGTSMQYRKPGHR